MAKRNKEEDGRLQSVRTISQNPQFSVQQELFRSDAKATADGAWLGGWKFRGGQKASEARWWAFEVKSDVFPWLFCKKDPKRIIAALEMLTTIVCIMVFGIEGSFTGCFTGGELNQAAGELYKDLLKERENKLASGSAHKCATPKRKVTERLK